MGICPECHKPIEEGQSATLFIVINGVTILLHNSCYANFIKVNFGDQAAAAGQILSLCDNCHKPVRTEHIWRIDFKIPDGVDYDNTTIPSDENQVRVIFLHCDCSNVTCVKS